MSRLFYHVMQDNLGNLLFDVSGTMRLAGTGTLATIYGDEAQTVILPNPMTNHPSYASFKCFLAPGDYDFYLAKPGYSFETLTGIQGYGSMAQQDYHNVIITGGTATFTGGIAFTDRAGDNMRSIYDNLMAAGGTNRLFIEQIGDAPSLFRGSIQNGSGPALFTDVVNSRVGIGIGVFAPSTTLDVDGGVLIRQTMGIGASPTVGAGIYIKFDRTIRNAMILQAMQDTGGFGVPLTFWNAAGVPVGTINTDGSSTSYNTTSDARLKHAVATLVGELAVIRALRPVRFKWNADDSEGVGFIAGEVAEHVQGVITGEPDALEADGVTIRPQMIDMSKLVPYLVGAVQTLAARVDTLTERVTELEAGA